jgi:hypothetical protein
MYLASFILDIPLAKVKGKKASENNFRVAFRQS